MTSDEKSMSGLAIKCKQLYFFYSSLLYKLKFKIQKKSGNRKENRTEFSGCEKFQMMLPA